MGFGPSNLAIAVAARRRSSRISARAGAMAAPSRCCRAGRRMRRPPHLPPSIARGFRLSCTGPVRR
ncbi:hypothetical protein H1W37_06615 [Stappia taiwanensis]|uniref:Uncharacterized protein n=1 Tax=Stappia taiwanensis TaxID=992267 RepID=A0A838XW83_9HYPH|nr:hypothetical protein [Stappia taiwanensis]